MLLLVPKLRKLINNNDYQFDLVENLSEKELASFLPYHDVILANHKTLRTMPIAELDCYLDCYLTGLFLNQLLTKIYQYYFNMDNERAILLKQQSQYYEILKDHYDLQKLKLKIAEPSFSLSVVIRKYHPLINFLRLSCVRAAKILYSLAPLLKSVQKFSSLVTYLKYLIPVFNYLSWIAFLPRLLCNIYDLFIQVVPGFWMNAQEKKIGAWTRCTTQLSMHWFEWSNDLVWCIGGILGCFLFIGGLATIGIYVSIALFSYDIILAGINAAINLVDLYLLREQYSTSKFLETLNPDKVHINAAYVATINQHINHQWWRGSLSIFNTVALFLAVSLTIPAIMAVNPLIIPIIAAAIILGITLGVYLMNIVLDKFAPLESINKVSKEEFSFFKKQESFSDEDGCDTLIALNP